jgi:prepilin signal peptidase PulO-like enzyme (type II secretory pathway)
MIICRYGVKMSVFSSALMEPFYFDRVMSQAPLFFQVCFYACFFFIGASLSDFLQCMIYRRMHRINVFIERSFCDSCGRQLKWYHLVPVISYVVMRGRCAYCGAPIDVRYAVSDFLSGMTVFFLARSDMAILFVILYAIVIVFLVSHDFLSRNVPIASLCLFLAANIAYALVTGSRPGFVIVIAVSGSALALLALSSIFRKNILKVLAFGASAFITFDLRNSVIMFAVTGTVFALYMLLTCIREKKFPRMSEIPFIGLACAGFSIALVL